VVLFVNKLGQVVSFGKISSGEGEGDSLILLPDAEPEMAIHLCCIQSRKHITDSRSILEHAAASAAEDIGAAQQVVIQTSKLQTVFQRDLSLSEPLTVQAPCHSLFRLGAAQCPTHPAKQGTLRRSQT
jgi:hypothetical protein